LFTATEETGMDGANGIKAGILKGDILLNMDSEDEGELYVGCAGGEDAQVQFKFKETAVLPDSIAFKLNVTGLKGGHSGLDIALGRGNANKIFFRLLKEAYRTCGVRLASINGGNLRNAIPREAFGLVTVPYENADKLVGQIAGLASIIKRELAATEPTLKIELSKTDHPYLLIDLQTQVNLTHAIVACPNGVIRMSDSMPGLVETSTNLASVKMKPGNTILITTSQRSSVETSKYDIANQVEAVMALAGATATHGDGYPGWKPNLKSEMLEVTRATYTKLFDAEPKVRAIHAGLECGLFLEKYPHFDMVSIGPQMYGVHSPDERLSISSTQKCWQWLTGILAAFPAP
jgi:dipeptidase D